MFIHFRGLCGVLGAALLTAAAGPAHAQAPSGAAVTVTSDLDYVPTAEYGAKRSPGRLRPGRRQGRPGCRLDPWRGAA